MKELFRFTEIKEMNIYLVFKNKMIITLSIAILVGMHILWDYYNGGVPTHYLLVQEDMPGFSNFWGLLTLPLLTWGTITFTENKVRHKELSNLQNKEDFSEILIRFFVSLTFGITLSVFWELGLENVLQYLIFLPILTSLFKPLYFLEYLLGFVLGMGFTFGGVLPIIFGIVILLMCFLPIKYVEECCFLYQKLYDYEYRKSVKRSFSKISIGKLRMEID